MQGPTSQERKSPFSRIGEDWGAVIIGFLLIALVVLGVLTRIPW